jgi:ABC-type lipoprotein release transport system permease subunit
VLASLLYGVGARDPLALTAGPLAMVLTVALAAWVPARRAARVAPGDSLRAED